MGRCGCVNGASNSDNNNRRCLCLCTMPHRDPWLITSQLMQIAAFLVSYVFGGLFLIGFVTMVMQQFLWCCRQTKAELLISSMLSIMAAGLAIWSGVYVLLNWKDPDWCKPIFFWNPDEVECGDRYSATMAFSAAALWLASATFTIAFVVSGRYTKWAEQCIIENNETETDPNYDDCDCEAVVDEITETEQGHLYSEHEITEHGQNSERTGSRKSTSSWSRRSTGWGRKSMVTKSEQFVPPEGAYDMPL